MALVLVEGDENDLRKLVSNSTMQAGSTGTQNQTSNAPAYRQRYSFYALYCSVFALSLGL